MKYIITIFLLTALGGCLGCFRSAFHNSHLKKFMVTTQIELVKTNMQPLHILKDTIYIFYYENYTIYKYLFETLVDTDSALNSEYSQRYFIQKENEPYGYDFQELNSNKWSEMTVESFLAGRTLRELPIYNAESDSLIRRYTDVNQKVVEVYATRDIKDISYNDTTYLYFSPKVKTSFSFSPLLDSIYKMKLTRIHLLYKPRFSKTDNIFLPERHWLYEMRELKENNSQTDIDLCKKLIELYNEVK